MSSITSFVNTFATYSVKLQRKVYNRLLFPNKMQFEIYSMLHKLLWDWCISGSCNCLLFPECCLAKAHFDSAGCLIKLKNEGTTKKTEKLTRFPSDQER